MASGSTFSKASSTDAQSRAPRLQLNLPAEGRTEPGEAVSVLVHNLSETGVLIETSADLAIGQIAEISLPHVGNTAAAVVWHSETLFGCRFVRPLSRAALSAAQLRNPLPPELNPVSPATEPTALESFGARLRQLRQERGLSLNALARLTHLSKPTLWAWESGKTQPRTRNMETLAAALGVDIDRIIGRPVEEASLWDALSPSTGNGSATLTGKIDEIKRLVASLADVPVDKVRITVEF